MNERLYEELDYCVPLGIPHSVFLSWNPVDQDKALAYRREMRTVHAACGTRKAEWEADPDAYIGHIEYCEGCARIAAEQDNLPEDAASRRGMFPTLLPKTLALKMTAELADRDLPKTNGEEVR